jgi:hypothetical protein
VIAGTQRVDGGGYAMAHGLLAPQFASPCGRAAGNVTDSGKHVAVIPLTPSATAGDMFYDASKGRIYVLSSITQRNSPQTQGHGLIEVLQQKDPDHYERIETIQSGLASRTGLFVPEWNRLFVQSRAQPGGPGSEFLVYETK